MHQRRREPQTDRMGTLFSAGVVSVLLAMTLVTANGWTPACAAYTPSDPMWYVLFCWVDPPEGDGKVG